MTKELIAKRYGKEGSKEREEFRENAFSYYFGEIIKNKINKNKALHIAFVMCSFIPYFGVISAWYKVFWLIKQPWFLLYHMIGCAIWVGYFLKWLELA